MNTVCACSHRGPNTTPNSRKNTPSSHVFSPSALKHNGSASNSKRTSTKRYSLPAAGKSAGAQVLAGGCGHYQEPSPAVSLCYATQTGGGNGAGRYGPGLRKPNPANHQDGSNRNVFLNAFAFSLLLFLLPSSTHREEEARKRREDRESQKM